MAGVLRHLGHPCLQLGLGGASVRRLIKLPFFHLLRLPRLALQRFVKVGRLHGRGLPRSLATPSDLRFIILILPAAR